MVWFYIDSGVGVMVVGIWVLCENVIVFGCIDVDDFGCICSFVEKLLELFGIFDDFDIMFVLMGNYIFMIKVFIDVICVDVDDDYLDYDMGGDIVLWLVVDGMVVVYDFFDNEVFGVIDCD